MNKTHGMERRVLSTSWWVEILAVVGEGLTKWTAVVGILLKSHVLPPHFLALGWKADDYTTTTVCTHTLPSSPSHSFHTPHS